VLHSIQSTATAIAHTMYRKSLLPWYGNLAMLLIKAGCLIQAGGRSHLFW